MEEEDKKKHIDPEILGEVSLEELDIELMSSSLEVYAYNTY